MWWCKKCCVKVFKVQVFLATLVDTAITLSHNNCLTILWSKWKSEKSNVLSVFKQKPIFLEFLKDIYFSRFDPVYKSLIKELSSMCELFGHVKMRIYNFEKTLKINSYKTVSQFTKQPWGFLKIYINNTIQDLNCVFGCFNVKYVEKLLRKYNYKFVVNSDESTHRKSGHLWLYHVMSIV